MYKIIELFLLSVCDLEKTTFSCIMKFVEVTVSVELMGSSCYFRSCQIGT